MNNIRETTKGKYMTNIDEIQDEIDILKEKLKDDKKLARKKIKQEEREEEQAEAYEAAIEFVKETPIHYLSKLDRYIVKTIPDDTERVYGDDGKIKLDVDGEPIKRRMGEKWTFFLPGAVDRTYPEFSDKNFKRCFTTALKENQRIHKTCTYSFHEYRETLNMMDTSDWLQPIEGQHHWIFDVIIQSIGGNKPENMEHVKHVLTYKYLHPECWLLPCLVFYGEGRVGKNLLVDSVLYTMLARETISAVADNLIGNFNSLIKGRAVVCINETVVGKHDRSKLYNQLAKPRAEINEKGVPQYEVDNAALYIIGSNDWSGATLLDRGMSDERLSVMCCPKGMGLKHWIAKHKGCTTEEAQQWLWKEGGKICENPIEVSKWLNYLIKTYGEMKQPIALHGTDYNEVMEIQTRMDETILQAVFTDPEFNYISVNDLYHGYLLLSKEMNISYTIGPKMFNKQTEMWLKENLPNIIKHTEKTHYIKEDRSKGYKEKTVWLDSSEKSDVERDNTNKYIGISNYREVWKGPEVKM